MYTDRRQTPGVPGDKCPPRRLSSSSDLSISIIPVAEGHVGLGLIEPGEGVMTGDVSACVVADAARAVMLVIGVIIGEGLDRRQMASPTKDGASAFLCVAADKGWDQRAGQRSGGADTTASRFAEAESGASFTPPCRGGMRT